MVCKLQARELHMNVDHNMRLHSTFSYKVCTIQGKAKCNRRENWRNQNNNPTSLEELNPCLPGF